MYKERLIWIVVIAALIAVSIPVYQWITTPTLPDAFDGWVEDCQRDYSGTSPVDGSSSRPESAVERADLDQIGGSDDQGRVYGMKNDLSAEEELPESQDHGQEHPMFPVRVTCDKVEVLPINVTEVDTDATDPLEIKAVSPDGTAIRGEWRSGSMLVWNCE